ncbi:MAG: Ig-like domain-containing protein, partial [Bifidobacterium sp.]|nr:Ig-like domain-containing protein [Bifidobacterium sp.]
PLAPAAMAGDTSTTTSTDSASAAADSDGTIDEDTGTIPTTNTGAPHPVIVHERDSDGRVVASLQLSRDNIGDVPDSGDLKATLNATVQPGDTYSVTIPPSMPTGEGTVYTVSHYEQPPSGIGTAAESTAADGTETITYTFTQAASVAIAITLAQGSDYTAQPRPMGYVGAALRRISWKHGTTALPDAWFTQVVTPSMAPSAVTRVSPSQDSVKAIEVGQDYVYRFDVNETDGVGTDTGYSSYQVNSAVNWGTTITIPVPQGFTLDQSATDARNAFTDGTTITQPKGTSGDLVISVPKGAGSQNYQNQPGYYFVGKFDRAAPATQSEVTAPAKVSITQREVDPQGKRTALTASAPAWSEWLRSKDETGFCQSKDGKCITVSIAGSDTPNELLLASDSKNTTLNFMGFGNNGVADLTDADIHIAVPSGFDATAIVTPKDARSLPGLTSYRYRITLLDGTVMSGTVKAGATITQSKDSPMRSIDLYPNLLAVGARTATAAACTSLVDDNVSCAGKDMLYLQGRLAEKYDDGTAVKKGDDLKTTISMSSPSYTMTTTSGATVTLSVAATDTQEAIVREQLIANAGVWSSQTKYLPGSTDAGYISEVRTGDDKQTTKFIYEPVFYYVLPAGFTYDKALGLKDPNVNSRTGKSATPRITSAQTDDGRQVVRIDYTGTGYWFDTNNNANQSIHLDIAPDTPTGTVPFAMYVRTATTMDNPRQAPKDLTYTMGDSDVYYVGSGTFTVDQAKAVVMAQLSQGNQATMLEAHTYSNDKHATNGYADAREMRFGVTNVNGSEQDLTNVRRYVVLPESGKDANGFTFRLTGPVTMLMTTGMASDLPYTVTYSTVRPDTLTNTPPDPSTYVTADQVSDWSKIRSVLITMPKLPAGRTAGRFILTGMDPTLVNDAGRTGGIATALYADGLQIPLVQSALGEQDTTPCHATCVTVRGKATITARLHWKDASGKDQYRALPDLTRQYEDNADEVKRADYPTTLATFSAADRKLMPANYRLEPNATYIVGDLTATYPGGAPAGIAKWNTIAKYYYEGSIVQYELSADGFASAMPITGSSSWWTPWTVLGLGVLLLAGGALAVARRLD